MKKLIIKPGCISCGACEFNAPEIFELTDVSHIKIGANVEKNEAKIENAINGCPVGVIAWSEIEK